MAEGQGSARAFFDYAATDARLDFVTLSEHDLWMDDGEWRELQDLAQERFRDGSFVPILGYEWTAWPDHGGHHNVFFTDPASARIGVQEAGDLDTLYRELHRRHAAKDVLIIPHAHLAGDWRQSDAELERLVELQAIHGSFEWFANRYLRNGFDLGFVAAGDNHVAKPGLVPPSRGNGQPGGLAAVLAPSGTRAAIFAALRDRRVYATSGQRIVLDATLDGHPMGTHLATGARRAFQCRVAGTAPIDRIDVVRGGDVVFSRSYLVAPLASHATLQVAFASSSEVFGPQLDNPRGYRPWRGTIEVEGARVVSVRPIGFDNPERETVKIEPATSRLSFNVVTRGRADSFLLELDGASAATALRVHLDAAREAGATSRLRPAAELPAADFALRLSDLVDGRLQHDLAVDQHVDSVSIQSIDPGGALDRTFEYVDLGPPAAGTARAGRDYYYLRVTQLDGGMAWTSPWWLGSEDARGDAAPRSR
jgi:hypothetical protein